MLKLVLRTEYGTLSTKFFLCKIYIGCLFMAFNLTKESDLLLDMLSPPYYYK